MSRPVIEPVLRRAEADDLPLILRAERDYMTSIEPAQLDTWIDAIDRNLALWIDNLPRTTMLVFDSIVAGFAMWMPDADDAQAALLITIQVLPDWRRQGWGRVLLDLFAQQAEASGHALLKLGVQEENPARRLYETAGYRFTGLDGQYRLYQLRRDPQA